MEQLSNNVVSYLSSDINDSTTSIPVVDGAVFPSSGDFTIRINNEFMKCTARSGNTLTVERASEGTSASAHTTADPVAAILSKRSLLATIGDFVQRSTFASRIAAGQAGRVWFQTDGPYQAVDDGANWQNYLLNAFVTLPSFSSPTWVNQGSADITTSKGFYHLVTPTGNVRAYVQSVPSAPYTITAAFDALLSTSNEAGICLRNVSGSLVTFGINQYGEVVASKWDNENSLNSNYTPDLYNGPRPVTWLKLEDDNTDRKLSISPNGQDYQLILTHSRTDFITPTQVGIFINGRGVLNLYHWG